MSSTQKEQFRKDMLRYQLGMASGPITSWQINGKTVETVADFIFLCSKIIADGDCSHEIKMLTPWKESYDQPR